MTSNVLTLPEFKSPTNLRGERRLSTFHARKVESDSKTTTNVGAQKANIDFLTIKPRRNEKKKTIVGIAPELFELRRQSQLSDDSSSRDNIVLKLSPQAAQVFGNADFLDSSETEKEFEKFRERVANLNKPEELPDSTKNAKKNEKMNNLNQLSENELIDVKQIFHTFTLNSLLLKFFKKTRI